MVADELLVVARRRAIDAVFPRRPITGRVGGENLVDEDEVAIGVGAKFELGVGENHAGAGGGVVTELIQGEAGGLCLSVERGADESRAGGIVDGLVMITHGGFRGGCKDGCGQALGLPEIGRKCEATDGAVDLVGFPAAADEIAAHDALDGQRLEFAHDHGAQLQVRVGDAAAGKFAGLIGQQVIGDQGARAGKPPQADLVENDALAGDAVRQDDVESGEPIAGDKEQSVAQVEDLADLTRREVRKRQAGDMSPGGGGEGGGDLGRGHEQWRAERTSGQAGATKERSDRDGE